MLTDPQDIDAMIGLMEVRLADADLQLGELLRSREVRLHRRARDVQNAESKRDHRPDLLALGFAPVLAKTVQTEDFRRKRTSERQAPAEAAAAH